MNIATNATDNAVYNPNLKLQCDYKTIGILTYREGTQLLGEKFIVERGVVFNLDNLPIEIREIAIQYGVRALLADRTSAAKANKVNKLDWMSEVFDQLLEGDWEQKRASSGKGKKLNPYLIELIMEKKGITSVAATKALSNLSKDQLKAIEARFAEELAERQAYAGKGVEDLTDLL